MASAEALDSNPLGQLLALRQHYLPHADDSSDNLANALWLDKHHWQSFSTATAIGISKAFTGQ